jgi:hypothetical protein
VRWRATHIDRFAVLDAQYVFTNPMTPSMRPWRLQGTPIARLRKFAAARHRDVIALNVPLKSLGLPTAIASSAAATPPTNVAIFGDTAGERVRDQAQGSVHARLR